MKTAGALQLTTPSELEIAFTRVFAAPRRLVFGALTQPELVQRWLLGPPGWTMPECEIDLRVGGAYRYVWRHESDGRVLRMGGVFCEIAAPERTVVTERFTEPPYPGEALVTTVLVERAGNTTLTTTARYESREIRDGALRSGMEKGISASYDRLDQVLASAETRETSQAGA